MPDSRRGRGRRANDAIVPLLVMMLFAFMVISAVATTVALLNRADVSQVQETAKQQQQARRFSRVVICALESAVIEAGEQTITGELFSRPTTPERRHAAQLYREKVADEATRTARSLGVYGFPGLTPDGRIDCQAFVKATDLGAP